jgi:hypothetical protein
MGEIVGGCTSVDGRYLALMPPNHSRKLSQGYQVYVKTNMGGTERKCFENFLNERNLTLHKTAVETVIHRRTR